jgi:hypothetical protein
VDDEGYNDGDEEDEDVAFRVAIGMVGGGRGVGEGKVYSGRSGGGCGGAKHYSDIDDDYDGDGVVGSELAGGGSGACSKGGVAVTEIQRLRSLASFAARSQRK